MHTYRQMAEAGHCNTHTSKHKHNTQIQGLSFPQLYNIAAVLACVTFA